MAVADPAYASFRLLASCRRFLPKPVTFIARLRLDATLYDPVPLRRAATSIEGRRTTENALEPMVAGGHNRRSPVAKKGRIGYLRPVFPPSTPNIEAHLDLPNDLSALE